MNRRVFLTNLTGCVVMTLGCWAPAGMAARPSAKAPPIRVPLDETFSYNAIKAYIGETFDAFSDQAVWGYVVDLKLVAVDGYRQSQDTEQFAAHFLGPAIDPLEGGVYHFAHPMAGEFKLLISPAKSDRKGQYYRADFNLLR